MSEKYKVRDQDRLHFITITTSHWADVFTRRLYKDEIVNSLRYCQQNKGLELYGWVLMTNHLHLITRAAEGKELQNIIRDFKKFTSTALVNLMLTNRMVMLTI